MRHPAATRYRQGGRGGLASWALPGALLLAWVALGIAAGEETRRPGPTPSEPPECTQARALCREAQQREREYKAAKTRVEADATVENIDRYRDAFLDNELAFSKLQEAAVVSGRAHGQVPSCFHQCPTLKEFFDGSRKEATPGNGEAPL